MFTIMLCSAKQQKTDSLEAEIRRFCNGLGTPYRIKSYHTDEHPAMGLDDVEKSDVYILDMDDLGDAGLQLGKRLTDRYLEALLFLHVSDDRYALVGYKIGAKRYMLKGATDDTVEEAMTFAYDCFGDRTIRRLVLYRYRDMTRVAMPSILYLSKENRSVRIQSEQESNYSGKSLQTLLHEIQDPAFIYLNRSTIVNMAFVAETKGNRAILTTGDSFDISRGRIIPVKEALRDYWGERNQYKED